MTDNCVDLYNPKVVRSAMGSTTRLDIFVVDSFLNVATLFDELGIITNAAVVRNGENVVIGNEGKGLPKEHSDICKNRVTISMHGNIESLNAACAGTIILWEMFRGGSHG